MRNARRRVRPPCKLARAARRRQPPAPLAAASTARPSRPCLTSPGPARRHTPCAGEWRQLASPHIQRGARDTHNHAAPGGRVMRGWGFTHRCAASVNAACAVTIAMKGSSRVAETVAVQSAPTTQPVPVTSCLRGTPPSSVVSSSWLHSSPGLGESSTGRQQGGGGGSGGGLPRTVIILPLSSGPPSPSLTRATVSPAASTITSLAPVIEITLP